MKMEIKSTDIVLTFKWYLSMILCNLMGSSSTLKSNKEAAFHLINLQYIGWCSQSLPTGIQHCGYHSLILILSEWSPLLISNGTQIHHQPTVQHFFTQHTMTVYIKIKRHLQATGSISLNAYITTILNQYHNTFLLVTPTADIIDSMHHVEV